MFSSPELERILLDIARKAVPARRDETRRTGSSGNPRNVLHVCTNVSVYSGMPGLIRRWIQQDAGRSHSLVLTKQAPHDVPAGISDGVRRSRGKIHVLNDARGGLVARARRLREVARSADVMVMHAWEQDVVPLMAFAATGNSCRRSSTSTTATTGSGWMPGISDVVANLRASGQRLSQARRRIEPARNLLLPTIMEPIERKLSRPEAKRQLGLPPDSLVLFSIARPAKFRTINGVSFADAHVPVLKQHDKAMLVVVGAGEEREDWAAAAAQVPGRIRSIGVTTETAVYFEAADVFVDSFPFGTNTSLLQAASWGVPAVTRHPYSAACDILGSDMPGLDGNLIRVKDIEEYTAVLSRLITDDAFRVALGQTAYTSVAGQHWGAGWQRTLDEVYRRALTLPRVGGPAAPVDEPSFDEPDVYLPRIHGGNFNPEWVTYFHMGVMPLRERWGHWTRLGARQGSRLPYSNLLPEWAFCRYARLKLLTERRA